MSPTWVEPKLEPIELDLSAAFLLERGFGRAELFALGPQLEMRAKSWQPRGKSWQTTMRGGKTAYWDRFFRALSSCATQSTGLSF